MYFVAWPTLATIQFGIVAGKACIKKIFSLDDLLPYIQPIKLSKGKGVGKQYDMSDL